MPTERPIFSPTERNAVGATSGNERPLCHTARECGKGMEKGKKSQSSAHYYER